MPFKDNQFQILLSNAIFMYLSVYDSLSCISFQNIVNSKNLVLDYSQLIIFRDIITTWVILMIYLKVDIQNYFKS